MAATGDFVFNCRLNSESYLTGALQVSGDACQTVSDTIVAGAANNTAAIAAFLSAKLEGISLFSDEDLTLTFVGTGNTNNVSVALTADEYQEWHNGSWCANPLANNCVAVLATNGTANNAVLTARIWTNA
jgi:hypothetical protein